MGETARPSLEAGAGLPVSPPIFVPAAVLNPPPARGPWLFGALIPFVVCCVLTLLSLVEMFNFGGPDGLWRSWQFRPLLTAGAWPLVFLPFVAVALFPRRVPVRVKAATLSVAVLVTTIMLVNGFREFHARQGIQPALLPALTGLQVPTGFVAVGRPLPGSWPVENSFPDFLPSAPDVTWFWKPTPTSGGACASLTAGYAQRAGWSFDAAQCRAIHISGRVVVALRAYDAKDLPAYPYGSDDMPKVPGVVVVAAPNDGEDY